MKNFEQICKDRSSIRKFIDKEIEKEKLYQVLNIIKTAPSAGNLQAYEVIVIKSSDIKEKLSEAALNQDFIIKAPIVLVFVAKAAESFITYGERGKVLYSIQDATIACTYAMLACEALGISSTWVGAFDEEKVIKLLNCKYEETPIALLPIGYTLAPKISLTRRKESNELFREI